MPEGRPDREITGITTLDLAGPTEASFVIRRKLVPRALESEAGVILVPPSLRIDDERAVTVPEVWAGVLVLLEHFYPALPPEAVVHPTAIVPESTTLGDQVSIGPYCVLEENVTIGARTRIGAFNSIGRDVSIGADCRLHDRVTLAIDTQVGDRVILHSGVVIGADGFKYEVIGGRLLKVPQVGNVVIEDDVEIGANSTVDRASFATTRIGARTKIDNMAHIGHNVEVGSDCLIVAQVGVGGSSKIGRGVIIGGHAGIADNTEIGDGSKIAAMAGLHGKIPPRSVLAGAPAMDANVWRKMAAINRKLPEVWPKLRRIADDLNENHD
ncbi:UDP-3-O-(3-hydroxymyristoyl)glucosamine N-acyltransferase [bacterium]|nr:UDP-3-O-(3-hydroxymyristoyl)glucosamine N-acyltransferase [bacterium]